MVDDFQVRGAERFLALSRALKAAGEKELRKELNRSMRTAVKPLIPKTRAAARTQLPKSGGLADIIARAPQRVQVRTGEQTAGVRLVVGKAKGGARAANKGRIRHPVFGTDKWVEQDVTPGWFDETLEREAPVVARPAVEQALKDMAERIAREVN